MQRTVSGTTSTYFYGVIAIALVLGGCGGGGSGTSDESGPGIASVQGTLTYHEHTKHLIDSRCVTCHRDGGEAPFSLVDYGDILSKQSALVYSL